MLEEGPVSAHVASPAALGSVPSDPVRALQHALYRAAKADPGRRFHALWDKVLRRDVLWRAWVAVRRNNGAPGIDPEAWHERAEAAVDSFSPRPGCADCAEDGAGAGVRGGLSAVLVRVPAQAQHVRRPSSR